MERPRGALARPRRRMVKGGWQAALRGKNAELDAVHVVQVFEVVDGGNSGELP